MKKLGDFCVTRWLIFADPVTYCKDKVALFVYYFVALRQQKQSSPVSAGSQQSLQDSSKHSHQSNEELPMTPLHSSKIESML